MQSLGNFFGDIQKRFNNQLIRKDAIQAVVISVIPESKGLIRNTKTKNKTLFIECHPSLRSLISIKKVLLLEKLKEFGIDDIR